MWKFRPGTVAAAAAAAAPSFKPPLKLNYCMTTWSTDTTLNISSKSLYEPFSLINTFIGAIKAKFRAFKASFLK